MANPLKNLKRVDWQGWGIKFPFSFENGRVATSEGNAHVDEGVQQVLGTCLGERVMLRNFGSQACNLPFQSASPEFAGMLQMTVQRALATWESRIENVSVQVNFDKDTSELFMSLSYGYRNLVTPGHQLLPIAGSDGGTRIAPPPSSGTVVRESGDVT